MLNNNSKSLYFFKKCWLKAEEIRLHNVDSCRKCGFALDPQQICMNMSNSSCDEVITWNCLNCENVEEHFHSNHYFLSNSIDNSLTRIR